MLIEDSDKYIKIKEEVRLILEKYPKVGYIGLLFISRFVLFISKEISIWFLGFLIYVGYYLFLYHFVLHEFNATVCFIFLIANFLQWEFYLKKQVVEINQDNEYFELYIKACKELKKKKNRLK